MPCDTITMTERIRMEQEEALKRLAASLATGEVSVVVGRDGALAFRGWAQENRGFLTDVCAYRKLLATNSPELRRAVARAEAISGVRVNERTIAAGVHSHDGGSTWGRH